VLPEGSTFNVQHSTFNDLSAFSDPSLIYSDCISSLPHLGHLMPPRVPRASKAKVVNDIPSDLPEGSSPAAEVPSRPSTRRAYSRVRVYHPYTEGSSSEPLTTSSSSSSPSSSSLPLRRPKLSIMSLRKAFVSMSLLCPEPLVRPSLLAGAGVLV
jgi:hypothetical protein